MARYAMKLWNGKYGNPARFIVKDNENDKYTEFNPAHPGDVAWVSNDLTKHTEYTDWESFEDEPVDDLSAVIM